MARDEHGHIEINPSYLKGGWQDKYVVLKRSGEPTDPEAIYFVLRLDNDPHARVAAAAYAASVMHHNSKFARDIRKKIEQGEEIQMRRSGYLED